MLYPHGYYPLVSEFPDQQWIPLEDGNFLQTAASWKDQAVEFQAAPRMPQLYGQNPNDLRFFEGKWGIFTINGQRVAAYVDNIDTASMSARVYYANNQPGIIDITMISLAEGPFAARPEPGPGFASVPWSPSPGPGPWSSGPGASHGQCRWMWIPVVGWQYICLQP
ncbi:hypothetical protein [Paenibacillus senegalensis]|uniref:hypothetical protein n=1 Tax=Paenibacillus senegalensis TaxID=1465766 RepID=UPI00028997A9|nr:hypothetical protein [Paenibacillus senegalensis]